MAVEFIKAKVIRYRQMQTYFHSLQHTCTYTHYLQAPGGEGEIDIINTGPMQKNYGYCSFNDVRSG